MLYLESHSDEHQRLEKKRKLKATFDEEYDEGEGGYLEELRREVEGQTEVNRGEFAGMEEGVRVQYEGVPPGSYVRMELSGEDSCCASRGCTLTSDLSPQVYPVSS